MAIGSAVVLFILGAVLAFGIEVDPQGLDLRTIGYIMMGAGVVGGLLGLMLSFNRDRRRTMSSTHEEHRTADGGRVVHTEQQV